MRAIGDIVVAICLLAAAIFNFASYLAAPKPRWLTVINAGCFVVAALIWAVRAGIDWQ